MAAAIENVLKKTRSGIISCLKSRGRLTAEELASAIGVSRVCIRRHLELLSRDELIAFDVEKHDRGRPSHVYYLTQKSKALFPSGYTSFAQGVLKQVERQFGRGAVCSIIAGYAEEAKKSFRSEMGHQSGEAMMVHFVALLNRNGYEASLGAPEPEVYVVEQRNCPMFALAVDYEQICAEELRAYRDILGVEVVRECRIADGNSSCIYKVPLSPGRPGTSSGNGS